MKTIKRNTSMIRYISLLFLVFLINSCAQELSRVTILKGKLTEGIEDVSLFYDGEWSTLSLTKDGTFIDTLEIDTFTYF